jgi:hypothetical protein
VQYTRRETVKVCGLEEKANEDLEKEIIDIAKGIGVPLEREDISVIHRKGRKKQENTVQSCADSYRGKTKKTHN